MTWRHMEAQQEASEKYQPSVSTPSGNDRQQPADVRL